MSHVVGGIGVGRSENLRVAWSDPENRTVPCREDLSVPHRSVLTILSAAADDQMGVC
jgi:hypothetical protein